MSERFQVRRALLSVSDKTGLVEYAQRLASHGVELVSTGGSARTLKEAGLAVKDVADLTGYPEMMEGRVKTLHPAVHGGLLYLRDKESHVEDAERHGIEPIDLVYINLYPFEATVASGAGFEECIENIDIGGPAMLRAAAKNGHSVAVCTDADDLAGVLAEMDDNDATVSAEHGRRLAAKTYARTAAYDAAISGWYAIGSVLAAGCCRGFAMAKIRTSRQPSPRRARSAPALPMRARSRARSCPTTISTIPMRPMS